MGCTDKYDPWRINGDDRFRIVLISLPVIFKGIHIDPLAPGETGYFLWMLLGYMVVTATLLVTFGRISDMFGRVRFYNLGFLIFTIGSILLWLTPGTGNVGALELISSVLYKALAAVFSSPIVRRLLLMLSLRTSAASRWVSTRSLRS